MSIQCRNLHIFTPTSDEKAAKVAVCPTCHLYCFLSGFDPESFEWPQGAPSDVQDGMKYIDWDSGCIMEKKDGKWQVSE